MAVRGRQALRLVCAGHAVIANHIHLLALDQGRGEIARTMQLLAGRIGQAYQRRKARNGAFWEDRYHATAVDSDFHLARCLAYIDLNMVRAGVVDHPAQWESGGYHEMQAARARYRIVDRDAVADALGLASTADLAVAHAGWIEATLAAGVGGREPEWSESVAVERTAGVCREDGDGAGHAGVVPAGRGSWRPIRPARDRGSLSDHFGG